MQETLRSLNPSSSSSNLFGLERQLSFESMNEIKSFDDLISLPISPQNLQYFCSDSSLKSRKEGSLKKRKAVKSPAVNSDEEKEEKDEDEKEKEKKMKADESPPKKDFIHVRARRGQATDSHSLAERVRRERISERMKYLQGLVPGCEKITGKAGMLDEIINYVQSLQRQVEFLSMKLATVNPWINFNIDNFFQKEVNLARNPSISTDKVSPELVEPSQIQISPMHQMVASCGLTIDMNFSDLAIRQNLISPLSIPDTFMEPSFNVHSSSWNVNYENICDLEDNQLPLQLLSGACSSYNLKMEK